jgi:hypothetical protein
MRAHPRLLAAALAAALLVSTANAGAPMPWVGARVLPRIPLGAPVRVDLEANCMTSVPADLAAKLRLARDGKPIEGAWTPEPPPVAGTGNTSARYRFAPDAPLAPGKYVISGLPPRFGGGKPGTADLVVTDATDHTPPPGRLEGATCRPPVFYMEGCGTDTGYIDLEATPDAPGASTERDARAYVAAARRRGEPYAPDRRWETTALSLGPTPVPGGLPAGKWIVTLRPIDAADNLGGPPCEVELTLPAATCAVNFPSMAAAKPDAPTVATAPPRRAAACARPGKAPGEWVSALDGTTLR